MTSSASGALEAELERLANEVATETLPTTDDDLVRLPVAQAQRRLAALRRVAEAVQVCDEPGIAVIGRRVTLREEDGETVSYALVFPGDGDPLSGWISADSPLGSAILDARVGDEVQVAAPAGSRTVRIVAIE